MRLRTWRARSPYLYSKEQGGPVIPPGTGFPSDSQGYGGGILTAAARSAEGGRSDMNL
jgi:hypothetical protein